MATEEELRKDLEIAKKATEDIKKELDEKKSKKAQDNEDEEDEELEGKKGQDEDKEDEEKKALKAQVESLTAQAKIPIVDKIITAQLSASVISHSNEHNVRSKLMNASLDQLTQQYELIKPFETKLNSLTSVNQGIPYMGSDAGSFDASLNDIDDEQLLQEVSG